MPQCLFSSYPPDSTACQTSFHDSHRDHCSWGDIWFRSRILNINTISFPSTKKRCHALTLLERDFLVYFWSLFLFYQLASPMLVMFSPAYYISHTHLYPINPVCSPNIIIPLSQSECRASSEMILESRWCWAYGKFGRGVDMNSESSWVASSVSVEFGRGFIIPSSDFFSLSQPSWFFISQNPFSFIFPPFPCSFQLHMNIMTITNTITNIFMLGTRSKSKFVAETAISSLLRGSLAGIRTQLLHLVLLI